MSPQEKLYTEIGDTIEDVTLSKMFGKPCLKINGKAFASFFENEMVFKLQGEDHTRALALDGSQLFDPSRKGRPMKEWVQVSYAHKKEWQPLTLSALVYVQSLTK